MSLVPAFVPYFGIDPCTFFCLTLIHALCKSFAISPSVKSKLKKNQKLTVCHMDQSFHATWHTKRQKNIRTFLLLFFDLKYH